MLRLARWARRLVRRWRGSLIGATPEDFGRDLGPVTRIVGHPLYLVGVNTVCPFSSLPPSPLFVLPKNASLFVLSVYDRANSGLVLAVLLCCLYTNDAPDQGTRHRCFIVVCAILMWHEALWKSFSSSFPSVHWCSASNIHGRSLCHRPIFFLDQSLSVGLDGSGISTKLFSS